MSWSEQNKIRQKQSPIKWITDGLKKWLYQAFEDEISYYSVESFDGEKQLVTWKGMLTRWSADFLVETSGQKGMAWYTQSDKRKKIFQ